MSYSSRKQTSTTNVGITSTDSAGNSQVKHTDKCTILVASHITLYIQVIEQKEETGWGFLLSVCYLAIHQFVREHPPGQSTPDTRLQVALVSFKRKNFFHVIWTLTLLNIQSCPNALVDVALSYSLRRCFESWDGLLVHSAKKREKTFDYLSESHVPPLAGHLNYEARLIRVSSSPQMESILELILLASFQF